MEKRHWRHMFLIPLMLCFVAAAPAFPGEAGGPQHPPEGSAPAGTEVKAQEDDPAEESGETAEDNPADDEDSAEARPPGPGDTFRKRLPQNIGGPVVRPAPGPVAPQAGKGFGLELVGTVVADDSRMTLAIISSPATRQQRIYREGDRVDEKALVKKISRNRVVIDSGSGEIILSLLHPTSQSIPDGKAAPQQATKRPGAYQRR